MKSFKPTTPEEVEAFLSAYDDLEQLVNEVVSDILSLSYTNPVTGFQTYVTSSGSVMMWADVDVADKGILCFPVRFLFQDAKTNRKEWHKIEEERKALEAAARIERDKERLAKEEAEERAEYERLKAKYGDNNA